MQIHLSLNYNRQSVSLFIQGVYVKTAGAHRWHTQMTFNQIPLKPATSAYVVMSVDVRPCFPPTVLNEAELGASQCRGLDVSIVSLHIRSCLKASCSAACSCFSLRSLNILSALVICSFWSASFLDSRDLFFTSNPDAALKLLPRLVLFPLLHPRPHSFASCDAPLSSVSLSYALLLWSYSPSQWYAACVFLGMSPSH